MVLVQPDKTVTGVRMEATPPVSLPVFAFSEYRYHHVRFYRRPEMRAFRGVAPLMAERPSCGLLMSVKTRRMAAIHHCHAEVEQPAVLQIPSKCRHRQLRKSYAIFTKGL